MKCIFLLVVLYILSTSKNPCFKIILFSFYRWRNESLKTLIYFSMVTQLLSVDSNLGLLILMPFLSQSTNQIFPEEPSFFHYRKKKKKGCCKNFFCQSYLKFLSMDTFQLKRLKGAWSPTNPQDLNRHYSSEESGLGRDFLIQ